MFLTASKSPPIDIIKEFFQQHGHKDGGCVRTDQGGELARSSDFQDMLLRDYHYTLEPTGADSPSQNGAVEIYNDKFAVRTRTLLYGSGLPAKFWSAALLHSVYLHNRLVHSETKATPFERYFGLKPDLSHLKVFGSRVCVKRSGDRNGKLDCNDFTGIFLGFTATDHNILYLDLDSGLVKRSHHVQFDKAWYLQHTRPPAAQLLYDLGLEVDPEDDHDEVPATSHAPWPPIATCAPACDKFCVPPSCIITPLPLRETLEARRPLTAAAARLLASQESSHTPGIISKAKATPPSDIVAEYLIGKNDMATVYMSPDPYFETFEEIIDLRNFDLTQHRTAGLCLAHSDNRLFLGCMTPSTPGAKIPCWRSRLKGAWLIKVGDIHVSSIADAQAAFRTALASGSLSIKLLFTHPEIRQDISHDGLPIVSSAPFSQQIHDQMNKRWDFTTVADYLRKAPPYRIVEDGDVLNYITRVIKLTRGKL